MLYLSRLHSYGKYFIGDTDDGTESLVTMDELKEYVCNLGIEIKGIETKTLKNGSRRITEIVVYQPPELASKSQFSMKFMYGVDIKTDGDGTITNISWEAPKDNKDIFIRLSEHANACANYVILYKNPKNRNIVIVLDDHIAITGKSFTYAATTGCRFDLTGVTNWTQAGYVYKPFLFGGWHGITLHELDARIIDSEQRMNFWRAVYVLQNGATSFSEGYKICKEKDTAQRVYKKYRREFKTLSECKFELIVEGLGKTARTQYVRQVLMNLGKSRRHEFSYMYSVCGEEIFNIIGRYTTCVESSVKRFGNFVRYFDVPADVQGYYIDFVNRAHDFIWNLYRRDV